MFLLKLYVSRCPGGPRDEARSDGDRCFEETHPDASRKHRSCPRDGGQAGKLLDSHKSNYMLLRLKHPARQRVLRISSLATDDHDEQLELLLRLPLTAVH